MAVREEVWCKRNDKESAKNSPASAQLTFYWAAMVKGQGTPVWLGLRLTPKATILRIIQVIQRATSPPCVYLKCLRTNYRFTG